MDSLVYSGQPSIPIALNFLHRCIPPFDQCTVLSMHIPLIYFVKEKSPLVKVVTFFKYDFPSCECPTRTASWESSE